MIIFSAIYILLAGFILGAGFGAAVVILYNSKKKED